MSSSSVGGAVGGTERVRVACRVRPRLPHELRDDAQFDDVVDVEPELHFVKVRKNKWDKPEAFTFDSVLPLEASQRRCYDVVCAPVVEAVAEGFNGAVLAYGQTGTGKTHTLLNLGASPTAHGNDANTDRGLVVRAVEDLFCKAAEDPERRTEVAVSYVQVYNEEVYDLLGDDGAAHGGVTAGARDAVTAATPLR